MFHSQNVFDVLVPESFSIEKLLVCFSCFIKKKTIFTDHIYGTYDLSLIFIFTNKLDLAILSVKQ